MLTPEEQEEQNQGLVVLGEAARQSRAPRTAVQAGIGGAGLVAFDYIVRGFFGVDLDPFTSGTEMPTVVAASITTIGAYLSALYMNRKGK